MSRIDDILAQIRSRPTEVRFGDLGRLCDHFFGEPWRTTAHFRIYRTPWSDASQVSIQNKKGKARAYQVRQVLKAIERSESEHAAER